MSESPADLLRRAADKLEGLDGCALQAPWFAGPVDGQEIMVSHPAHRDGLVIGRMAEEDVALVAALRGTVAPLVKWLRRTLRLAEIFAEGYTDKEAAVNDHLRTFHEVDVLAVARAILGEDSS